MRKQITTLLAVLIQTNSSNLWAEDKLDEIVVTAQKRTEKLADVPVSVQVFSGNYLQDMGIKKVEDLVSVATNFHYTESSLSTQVRVRGIGSGNSQGFEQSVGQYVDGVYYGRASLFRSPLYDIQQIEILKGSQNALFGKDSIAGALSIRTSDPTEAFYGKLSLGYTPETTQKSSELSVGGSLVPDVTARLTLRKLTEAGYFTNTTQQHDDPARDDWVDD